MCLRRKIEEGGIPEAGFLSSILLRGFHLSTVPGESRPWALGEARLGLQWGQL